MSVETLLSRLEGVRPTGQNKWQACCPAHEDNRASLSITVTDSGTVLLKCHAGCTAADVVMGVEMDLADLFPEKPEPRQRIVATYDYRNAKGDVVFQSVRYEPKDFRQRKPDGKGGWIWKLQGVEQIPYRLPEILASDKKRPVFIVEGEKDADRLSKLGLIATCNAGGAGKWRDSHTKYVAGRRCIIIEDNDSAGQKHAAQVAKATGGVILRLPNLPQHGDVSDWLDVCGSKEDLLRLAENPPPLKASNTIHAAAKRYLDQIERGETGLIETGIAALDRALAGGLAWGELFVVAGRPSHGKSVLGLQCVHHWSKQFPTLFITEEMSALQIGKRALHFASEVHEEHWREDLEIVRRQLEAFASERSEAYLVESCQTMAAAQVEIEDHVKDKGVRCVVVDYAQLLQSPGKQRFEQMAATSTALRHIATRHKIILLALVQMNQAIENRPKFLPKLSDLGDTGQWSRDADVIVFTVWPHRLDMSKPANEYQFFVAKNRNRAIASGVVECRFEPSRQRIVNPKIEDHPNYQDAFADYGYEQGELYDF